MLRSRPLQEAMISFSQNRKELLGSEISEELNQLIDAVELIAKDITSLQTAHLGRKAEINYLHYILNGACYGLLVGLAGMPDGYSTFAKYINFNSQVVEQQHLALTKNALHRLKNELSVVKNHKEFKRRICQPNKKPEERVFVQREVEVFIKNLDSLSILHPVSSQDIRPSTVSSYRTDVLEGSILMESTHTEEVVAAISNENLDQSVVDPSVGLAPVLSKTKQEYVPEKEELLMNSVQAQQFSKNVRPTEIMPSLLMNSYYPGTYDSHSKITAANNQNIEMFNAFKKQYMENYDQKSTSTGRIVLSTFTLGYTDDYVHSKMYLGLKDGSIKNWQDVQTYVKENPNSDSAKIARIVELEFNEKQRKATEQYEDELFSVSDTGTFGY